MKLYHSPGACSLASDIALEENGVDYETVKVDLKTHKTQQGRDYYEITPRGYVPALETEDMGLLTENPAVLSWLADHGRRPLWAKKMNIEVPPRLAQFRDRNLRRESVKSAMAAEAAHHVWQA